MSPAHASHCSNSFGQEAGHTPKSIDLFSSGSPTKKTLVLGDYERKRASCPLGSMTKGQKSKIEGRKR